MYPPAVKNKAKELIRLGYSVKEIGKELGISKSTSSLWVRYEDLDFNAKERLSQRRCIGQKNLKAYRISKKRNIYNKLIPVRKKTFTFLDKCSDNKILYKIMCSLLFWAEGGKKLNTLVFVNSNPLMMELFVTLLRKAYVLDESKFRIIIHIHEYHNEFYLKNFWSKITSIPKTQFSKSYLKPHTGIRKKIGYKGCVCLKYYDAEVARELNYIYNALAKY